MHISFCSNVGWIQSVVPSPKSNLKFHHLNRVGDRGGGGGTIPLESKYFLFVT